MKVKQNRSTKESREYWAGMERLDAAPVPCAASPADTLTVLAKWERRADRGFDPEESETSYAYWQGVRAVCAELRATGEGARDEQKPNEVSDVQNGASDRHHAVRGNDPVLPEVPEDREVAADRLAAPVAVSLDPHRLHDCEWKNAILDACVVDWILSTEHENDPRRAINDLLCWQQKLALDPAVSEDAAKLHARIADSVPLSAIRALVQQWREEANIYRQAAKDQLADHDAAGAHINSRRADDADRHATELAALCRP